MGHYIYKYVYNNKILYIGKNDTNLINRIKSHCHPDDKLSEYLNAQIYYFEVASSLECDIIESILINKYNPLLNTAKKIQEDMEITYHDEDKWKLYDEKDFQIMDSSLVSNHKQRSYRARKGRMNTKIKNLKSDIQNLKANKILYECIQQKFIIGDYVFENPDNEQGNEIKNIKFTITDNAIILDISTNIKGFVSFKNQYIMSYLCGDANEICAYIRIMKNYNWEDKDMDIVKDIRVITLKETINNIIMNCKKELKINEKELEKTINELTELEQEYSGESKILN